MDVKEKLKTMLSGKEKEELGEIIDSLLEKHHKEVAYKLCDDLSQLVWLLAQLYINLGFHPDIEKKAISQMKEGIAKKLALLALDFAKE